MLKKKYLEEIMNYRMFKFFQGHVIAHNNVLISHNLFKPFLGEIFIFKKIHRSTSRRLGRSGYSKLGQSSSAGIDESKSRTCTDGYLEKVGGTTELGLTTLDFDNPCFTFLSPRWIGRLLKSIVLDKSSSYLQQLNEAENGSLVWSPRSPSPSP